MFFFLAKIIKEKKPHVLIYSSSSYLDFEVYCLNVRLKTKVSKGYLTNFFLNCCCFFSVEHGISDYVLSL